MTQARVRQWWILWKSGYRNQATVTTEKPKEFNDTLTQVFAKQDLQPLIDKMKTARDNLRLTEAFELMDEFLKAWENKSP